MDYYAYGDLVVSVGNGELADVTVFGFERSIALEQELVGASAALKELAALSGTKDGTVMAGFSSPGAPMSVAVCHKGKLYDITVGRRRRARRRLLVEIARLVRFCRLRGRRDRRDGGRADRRAQSYGRNQNACDRREKHGQYAVIRSV